MKLTAGSKLWFEEEKRPYTVRCCNERYAICTKPFNPQRTVLYCIVDLEKQIRGPENLVFGFGAETDEQCSQMLDRIIQGKSEISHRNRVQLRVVKTEKVNP